MPRSSRSLTAAWLRATYDEFRGRHGQPRDRLGHRDRTRLYGGRRRARARAPRKVSIHSRPVPRHVPRPPMDDPPVRGLCVGGGDDRALSLPARARPDGSLGRVRPADAARLRLRRSARGRRGGSHRGRDRLARRHGAAVRGDPARPGLDVDDDQRAGIAAPSALRARCGGAGHRRRRATRHHAERHPQGVHRAWELHLPAEAVDAADHGSVRVLRGADPELEHDLDLGLPHPRSGLDRRAGARVHARERNCVLRGGDRRRAVARRLRRASLLFLQRAQPLLPGGGEVPRRAKTLGADHERALRRRESEGPGPPLPRTDRWLHAYGAAAAEQHRARCDSGAVGGVRRRAVAAHELVRRSARASVATCRAPGAADTTDPRERSRRHGHGGSARRLVLHRGAHGRARAARVGADRADRRARRRSRRGRSRLRPGRDRAGVVPVPAGSGVERARHRRRQPLPRGRGGADRAAPSRPCGGAASARAHCAAAGGAQRGRRGGCARPRPRSGARHQEHAAADARGSAGALHDRRDLQRVAGGVGNVRRALRATVSAALAYHRATNVEAGGSDEAPELDYSTRPHPFKDYSGTERLPLDVSPAGPLLRDGAGIVRSRVAPWGQKVHFRAYSSAGALYPVEVYVATPAAVLGFDPLELGFAVLGELDLRPSLARAAASPELGRAAAVVVLTGIHARTGWKYQERGYRHIWWDAGTMLANLLALAAADDLAPRLHMAFVDRELNEAVGIDGIREYALAVLALGGAASDPAENTRDSLSLARPKGARFPLAEAAHAAGGLPDLDAVRAWRAEPDGDEPRLDRNALARTIRTRTSVRKYSDSPLPREELAELLAWSEAPIPADGPRVVQQIVTVANVEGLEPGIYDARLNLLQARDEQELREQAGFVAMEQDHPKHGAVNVFQMADLDAVVADLGDRGYRWAQLEAGIRAGRVQVGAFMHGWGAAASTFYDEEVSRFLETSLAPMLMVAV